MFAIRKRILSFYNYRKMFKRPDDALLKLWATSEWPLYQAWIFHHDFLTTQMWKNLRRQALRWEKRPLISIITPVFNTEPHQLHDCLLSVVLQAYPNWELCLVDDASTNPQTRSCLATFAKRDRRVRLQKLPSNQGICAASNRAIEMAQGHFLVFLDHDDRLALDALFRIAEMLRNRPELDMIYSDRDMLSGKNRRFMYLFKPDWSPETLLSGNYLFHLMAYRTALVKRLGGLRRECEGSQDYDLVLRAAETGIKVAHLPHVLYHWRRSSTSIAAGEELKQYVFEAGKSALEQALKRRSLPGRVEEMAQFGRGTFHVHLEPLPTNSIDTIILNTDSASDWRKQLHEALSAGGRPYIVVLNDALTPIGDTAAQELSAWLRIDEVAMVTGRIADQEMRLHHGGLVMKHDGMPLHIYQGAPLDAPSYMSAPSIVRNVSLPHPFCFAIRRSDFEQAGGLSARYQGYHAVFDLALRLLQQGKRLVYTPKACFSHPIPAANGLLGDPPPDDLTLFKQQWRHWLEQGDPFYHPALTVKCNDMGLECDTPP